MDWAKTSARRDKKHLSFGICAQGFTVVEISNNGFIIELEKNGSQMKYLSDNSHIWYLHTDHTLLRWRKECGQLGVLLARGSAVQAPIHSVACVIFLINFYQ